MNKIDRHTIYSINCYTLKHFVELSEEEARLVWSWRNNEKIRQWMSHQDIIPFDSHMQFLKSLEIKDDKHFWLVYKKGKPIAVCDAIDIDYEKKEVEPGYYLSPELLDSGEGLFLNYYFRYFLYNIIGFDTMKGKIVVGNDRAYLMSTFCGLKVINLLSISGVDHVYVRGVKEDFNKIDASKLVRSFAKYAMTNEIDWNVISK